ncbi:uncharacterized protein [Panulirus ornatus]|uniref:uncharacterized protein n=1 Tax=Panulirus ornatus TaxID=150431 RepID=UPI003A8ADECB
MKIHVFLCVITACVIVATVSAQDTMTPEGKEKEPSGLTHKSTEASRTTDVLNELLMMTVDASRSVSYSNILALNVTNVIILAIITLALLTYSGVIDLGLARSLEGPVESNVATVSSALASLTTVVHKALQVHQKLQSS